MPLLKPESIFSKPNLLACATPCPDTASRIETLEETGRKLARMRYNKTLTATSSFDKNARVIW